MAIKGKKKQQSRGSQARRRPAMAPRPSYAGRGRDPWYRTAGGRVAAAIIVVVLIAALGGTIAAINSNNSAQQEKKAAVNDYTARVRTTLQELSQPVASLAAFPPQPSQRQLRQLPDAIVTWRNGIEGAQSSSSELRPPEDLQNVNVMFVESIIEYLSAINSYEAVTRVKGESRADRRLRELLIRNASDDRNRATALWTTGVALLDETRQELGLDPSRITNPLLGTPAG
jgi:hypothetical protein